MPVLPPPTRLPPWARVFIAESKAVPPRSAPMSGTGAGMAPMPGAGAGMAGPAAAGAGAEVAEVVAAASTEGGGLPPDWPCPAGEAVELPGACWLVLPGTGDVLPGACWLVLSGTGDALPGAGWLRLLPALGLGVEGLPEPGL